MTRLPLSFAALCALASPAFAQEKVDFARDVLPILSDACFKCHGPDEKARKGDLRLDTKEDALRKGGPIVPGKSAGSRLVERIASADPDEVMPPPKSNKKLKPEQVAILKKWIDQGATWGQHWSFVKPVRPALPVSREPKASGFVRNPIDNFILARLEKEKLLPSAEADRERLIRRVTLDLTGLPPTPDEVDAFLKDAAPNAYEKVVDRLLASPALRRAHGVGLARRRPLRRLQRLPGRRRAHHVAVARLGGEGVQRQPAVRPVHRLAARRRPAAESHAASRCSPPGSTATT